MSNCFSKLQDIVQFYFCGPYKAPVSHTDLHCVFTLNKQSILESKHGLKPLQREPTAIKFTTRTKINQNRLEVSFVHCSSLLEVEPYLIDRKGANIKVEIKTTLTPFSYQARDL